MSEEQLEQENSILRKTRFLDRNVLKYIIIGLMLSDHLVQLTLPNDNPFYIVARTLARLTGPIMFYFLAEGFNYTKNVKKYLLRLGIFALISHIPFVFFETHQWSPIWIFEGDEQVSAASFFYIPWANQTLAIYNTSVIFTLFLGLLTLTIWKKTKIHVSLKIILTILISYLSFFGDWNYFAILMVLIFYFLKEKPVWMWVTYSAVCLLYYFGIFPIHGIWPITIIPTAKIQHLWRLGALLVIPTMIFFYNGKPGIKSSFNKWFFYIFYPAHLIILGVIFTYFVK